MTQPSLTHKAGEVEIKMSYGLMIDLQRLLPDTDNIVTYISSDPYVRDHLVRRAMTLDRKSIEKEEDLISAGEIDLMPDEVVALLDWISSHLLHFFTSTASNLAKLAASHQEKNPLPTP